MEMDNERPRDRMRRFLAMEIASHEAALIAWAPAQLPLTKWKLAVLNEIALFFNRYEAEQAADHNRRAKPH